MTMPKVANLIIEQVTSRTACMQTNVLSALLTWLGAWVKKAASIRDLACKEA